MTRFRHQHLSPLRSPPFPSKIMVERIVQLRRGREEKPVPIEEVRREIAKYQPTTFREKAAYERYRQTLQRPWAKGKEDEIHRLFYSLIKGERRRKDFEHYYKQLYRLVPEWLNITAKKK